MRLSRSQLGFGDAEHLLGFVQLRLGLLEARFRCLKRRVGFLHHRERFPLLCQCHLQPACRALRQRLILLWFNQCQQLPRLHTVARIDAGLHQPPCDTGTENLLVVGAESGGIGDGGQERARLHLFRAYRERAARGFHDRHVHPLRFQRGHCTWGALGLHHPPCAQCESCQQNKAAENGEPFFHGCFPPVV